MIEAFDHCRANVDASNPEHDMCKAIRAAALSGMCSSDSRHLNKAQVASSKRWKCLPILRQTKRFCSECMENCLSSISHSFYLT